MADVKAISSGNYTTPGIWSTGSVPGANDRVYANGNVITITSSITCNSLNTIGGGGASAIAGGYFNPTADCTITASLTPYQYCIYTATSGINLTVVGNINGGSQGGGFAALRFDALGGVLNTIGTITGGIGGPAIYMNALHSFNHTGPVYAGDGSVAITLAVTGVFNHIGDAFGTTFSAVQLSSSSATYNHYGYARAGLVAAINNSVNASLNVFGGSVAGSNGCYGIIGRHAFNRSVSPTVQVFCTDSTTVILQSLSNVSAVLPANSDVRAGVVFNSGQNTGTCAVPAANSVGYGVPVGNTTGTAVIGIDSFLSAITASTHPFAVRLSNVATNESVGEIVEQSING